MAKLTDLMIHLDMRIKELRVNTGNSSVSPEALIFT